MRAWVDESVRNSPLSSSMYLLGATVSAGSDERDVAQSLRSMAPRNRKLHWRELGADGRTQMIDYIADLHLEHLIVVATPLRPEFKQERARGLCLERLMWELGQRKVERVVFESRSPAQDRADRRRIDGLRAQRTIPNSLYVDWVPGATDPWLWVSDLMLGAVGQARATGSPVPASLAPQVTEVRVDL